MYIYIYIYKLLDVCFAYSSRPSFICSIKPRHPSRYESYTFLLLLTALALNKTFLKPSRFCMNNTLSFSSSLR